MKRKFTTATRIFKLCYEFLDLNAIFRLVINETFLYCFLAHLGVPTWVVLIIQYQEMFRIIDYRRLLYFPAPHRAFHSKTPERAKKEKNCYCSLYNTRKILISRKKEWLVVLDDHLSLSWYFWIEKKSIDEIWWENYSKTHISTTAEFPDNFYFCHFLLLDFFASSFSESFFATVRLK